MRLLSRVLQSSALIAALSAAPTLVAPDPALAQPYGYAPREYLRWDRHGRLNYRLLLRRYIPVSGFRYGRDFYGYPYSAYGGLREPAHDGYAAPAGYYYTVPDPYASPLTRF